MIWPRRDALPSAWCFWNKAESAASVLRRRFLVVDRIVNPQLRLGLTQSGLAALAAFAVVLLARGRQIHLERETVIALFRGLTQIMIIGSILVLVLHGPRWTSVIILAAMTMAAAATSARRGKKIPGAFPVSLYAIAGGAGCVIALMTWAGVIGTAITAIVPVGSMLIANAMNANGLVLDRFRSEIQAHAGQIETALALGASPEQTVVTYIQASYQASLIPAVDNLRSLGIVWIPGLMAGMVLSGAPPLYAAIYQFVVLAMIFAASGLTCLISTTLIRERAFSTAEQLLLR
ncbi:MAG: ABC transporter permease [Acidobacteria bacterium]|nr:ABC transporter permease [Acidobacteriota bacterium]